MPAPGGQAKSHLWILVTDACEGSAEAVIVSLTTLRLDRDQTVILQRGDHPFITHQTAVLYSDARIVDVSHIDAMIHHGTAVAHEPCSGLTLELVQDGLLQSPFTARKVISFCKRAWRKA